jgi:hypothetical protein
MAVFLRSVEQLNRARQAVKVSGLEFSVLDHTRKLKTCTYRMGQEWATGGPWGIPRSKCPSPANFGFFGLPTIGLQAEPTLPLVS